LKSTGYERKAYESASTPVQWDLDQDYRAADTHSEKDDHICFASFYEAGHGDTWRCPGVKGHVDQHGSFCDGSVS